MKSKERVKIALTRNGIPDRIPIQFDLCKSLIEHFGKELKITPEYAWSYYEDLTYRISANEIRTKLGSDVVVVGGTMASDFKPIPVKEDITINEFGMKMKPTNLYVEAVERPLRDAQSIKHIEEYDFPDPYAKGRFDIAKLEIDKYGNEYFIIGDCELSIFELAWQLTGMEKYMIAMAMQEEWVEKLNDRIEYWTTHLALQMLKIGVDAIWFGEDLGTQTSTIMSPDMWRKMFKSYYIRMFELLKKTKSDLIIIMHSDGAVASILNDFIEIGVDVYNPVQPNIPGSEPMELKEKYGNSIAFFGGIDQQELLPSGNVDEIREEIKLRCEILGKNGGYMLAPAHIIQSDTTPETVKIMINAAKEFGKY